MVLEMFGGDQAAAQPFLDMFDIGDLKVLWMNLTDHIFNAGTGLQRKNPYGDVDAVFETKEDQKAIVEVKTILIQDQIQEARDISKECK